MSQLLTRVDPLIVLLASWFFVVGVVYLLNKQAVKYFIAIYWKSEGLVRYIRLFAEKLSFIPLRAYLIATLLLFLMPVFFILPIVRPDGQIQILQGFIYMLIGGTLSAVQTLIKGGQISEAATHAAGVTPIVPGVTLPWDQLPYLAAAIVVAVLSHELMHGYAALRYGIPLKSVGVFSLVYIFSGAFVEPDEESFKKAGTDAKVAVLASGVAANVVLAIAAMLLGLVGASAGLQGAVFGVQALGIQPGDRVLEMHGCGFNERVYTPDDFLIKVNTLAGMGPLLGVNKTIKCKPGDKVVLVVGRWFDKYEVVIDYSNFTTTPKIIWLYTDGSLYKGGIRAGDVIKRIEGCGVVEEIRWSGQLITSLQEIKFRCKPGDVIRVVVERNTTQIAFNITLVEREGVIFFGLGPGSLPLWGYDEGPIRRDQLYNTDFARLVFWLVVVNYGLAVLNALPIYPLDGGQLVAAVVQRKLGEKNGKALVNIVTWALAAMLIFNATLGLLGEQYRILQSIK